ncbi:MAG: glycerophosphodiester phosphodiesterase family protein [Oscillospiraceae bacterium]
MAALIAFFFVLGLGLFALFLIFPERASEDACERFARRAYAHRGLYDNEGAAPENSLAAFELAMQNGYGCELDVQFTKDKKLIVFHDNDFGRVCGVDTPVWELTWDEVKELRLFGSAEGVPLFSEVLETVNGREPLIVEIKAEGICTEWYYELCRATLEMLRGYGGEFCVESFHPCVVGWFKKHADDLVRGQLVNGHKASPDLGIVNGMCAQWLLCDVISRPHFVAYREQDIGLPFRIVRALGALGVVWTCRTPERHAQLEKLTDAIIFERYMPSPHFNIDKETDR